MHNYTHIFTWLIIGVMLASCEIPKKPDFTTSHKVEAPVMYNKTFQFMGEGNNVLIDTTSADMDSLFSIDGENFITITKEQDFEFGDLNDAIPTIDVDPTAFESQVGEIEITDFSSDGDLGSANIEEVTGNDPNIVPAGTVIPAGDNSANPVRIAIGANTDFFKSATIKNGALNIQVTNNLGFDFKTADIQVIDTTTNVPVGSTASFSAANGNQLFDGVTEVATITFSEGDELINLGVEIVISWDDFSFPANPGELTVNSVVGNGLVASEVQAALDSQDFSTISTATFSNEEFEFTQANHFIELKSGFINVDPIQNELEFAIDLVITFNDIKGCPASLTQDNSLVTGNDPLVISYVGANRIGRADNFGPGTSPDASIDISGCELYALGNEVSYSIDALTENTKEASEGDQIRVINELQKISSAVEIMNLTIKQATGIIKQQNVLLNEDEGEDEQLDLFNPNEAELTEIDGLSDLSKQLDGLEFTNPRLSINYFSNIGVPTTIYGAFVGTNSNGKEVYLSGTSAGYAVQPGDPVSGLTQNGVQLANNQMIKFTLDEITNPTGTDGTPIEFNTNNSTVAEFLNNLPNEIRFIGKAVINEDEQEATILDTLIFEPKISIDIPLAFATEQAATFTDTTDQDLGDMPSPEKGDTRTIKEGRLIIEYENGLPLEVNLEIAFLDSLKSEFDAIPVAGESMTLLASGIDAVSRFATNPTSGSLQIALNESQLRQLYKTRFLEISAELLTTDENGDGTGDEVKVRTTDSIKLSVRAEFSIESEIN